MMHISCVLCLLMSKTLSVEDSHDSKCEWDAGALGWGCGSECNAGPAGQGQREHNTYYMYIRTCMYYTLTTRCEHKPSLLCTHIQIPNVQVYTLSVCIYLYLLSFGTAHLIFHV